MAPSVIKGATNEINNIAQQRIDEVISQGGKEIEHVLPKILREAIEDIHPARYWAIDYWGTLETIN